MPDWQDNRFYGEADYEVLTGPRKRPTDDRSPFQVDRDRVVFSYAFRRLQSKTQVFQSGEFDFYRTRLTHSMEVARIGRSICEHLARNSELLGPDFQLDPDLTEGVCYAHDLGHPPFGHIGERALNRLMAGYGGFEGNAQTLRILTLLIYPRPEGSSGMSPTRAFLDGVLKYKKLRRECWDEEGEPPPNHFLYDEQAPYRDFALGSRRPTGEDLNEVRSIECQIMDWADDAAYSLNDIVDGIEARYVTTDSLERWASEAGNLGPEEADLLTRVQRAVREGYYERKFSSLIGEFLRATALEEIADPLLPESYRYRFRLRIEPEIFREAQLYQRIARELIFDTQAIQQIEFKGSRLLGMLFDALMENYGTGRSARHLRLVPEPLHQLFAGADGEPERARRICDFLAGLTDGQAVRTYKRWFDPDFASILDLD